MASGPTWFDRWLALFVPAVSLSAAQRPLEIYRRFTLGAVKALVAPNHLVAAGLSSPRPDNTSTRLALLWDAGAQLIAAIIMASYGFLIACWEVPETGLGQSGHWLSSFATVQFLPGALSVASTAPANGAGFF